MKKIVIVGCGGAGKSTLARELGQRLRLPVIHLDALFWKPGWVMIPKDEERRRLAELLVEPAWVIDGNYNSTMPIRFEAADTIIFLDFPVWLCLWRVLKRWLQYRGHSRPDMSPGCPEKLNWQFLGWVCLYRSIYRPKVLKRLAAYGQNRRVLIFEHPRQLTDFLCSLMTNESVMTIFQ